MTINPYAKTLGLQANVYAGAVLGEWADPQVGHQASSTALSALRNTAPSHSALVLSVDAEGGV